MKELEKRGIKNTPQKSNAESDKKERSKKDADPTLSSLNSLLGTEDEPQYTTQAPGGGARPAEPREGEGGLQRARRIAGQKPSSIWDPSADFPGGGLQNDAYQRYNEERPVRREDYPEMSDEEWAKLSERQRKIDDQGLGGLLPRTAALLRLGATFYWRIALPTIVVIVVAFGATYAKWGSDFIKVGNVGQQEVSEDTWYGRQLAEARKKDEESGRAQVIRMKPLLFAQRDQLKETER